MLKYENTLSIEKKITSHEITLIKINYIKLKRTRKAFATKISKKSKQINFTYS